MTTKHLDLHPRDRELTASQVSRLGALTGVDEKELRGATIAQLHDRLGDIAIDPNLFLFRRICGRVVKHDPVTGDQVGVSFATVQVEDTDVNLISYQPGGWQWGWFFPFLFRREVIATVRTDACGNFCVWVPRFDIDWVLKWRLSRHCFTEIFTRPNLSDLVRRPVPIVPRVPHGPGDPGPLDVLSTTQLHALGGRAGLQLGRKIDLAEVARGFGSTVADVSREISARAFDRELPPPLPAEFQRALVGAVDVPGQEFDGVAAVRSTLADTLRVDTESLAEFDPYRFAGPFLRCFDTITPEWSLIFDVPDITFRVLQDIDGDGDEETIYREGLFDVRWNAGSIAPVTLVADDTALASTACHVPPVECTDVPALLSAGLMPLTGAYFDGDGYATRPNKPTVGPAQTPLCGELQLYGCTGTANDAAYYRVQRSLDGGATYSPLVGLPLVLNYWPSEAPVLPHETPADGWYAVRDPEAFFPQNLLIELPSIALGQGVFKVELADAAKSPLGIESAAVPIWMDNTAPTVQPTQLDWRFATEPDTAFDLPGRDLLVPCATIHRGASPQDIVVRYQVAVAAHHLRSAAIDTAGCGDGNTFALDGSAPSLTSHWHETALDNSVTLFGRYTLAGGTSEGAYAFTADAASSAVNPAGEDAGHAEDWNYDPVFIHTPFQWNVAVVNG